MGLIATPALAADLSPFVPESGPSVPVDGQCACPANAGNEGEPACFDGYNDNFNGGCNSTPVIYGNAVCSPICGNAGVYTTNGAGLRDTDWYRITVGAGNFVVSAVGDGFAVQCATLNTVCPPGLLGNVSAGSCAPATPPAVVGPTTFVIFVSRDNALNPVGVPACGAKYTLSISGPGIPSCGSTPVDPSTWGQIKSAYEL
ncbi:MAG TPA: hypothetical protein VNM87_01240 [Candidatus Udaeobacter sp.]|nr:hypothetical protein [Candidatus Udaeobacter sp.]